MPDLLNRIKEAFERGTQASYQDRIFRSKLRRFYRIVLILLVAAAIGIIVKIQIDNRIYTEAEIVGSMERVGTQTSEYRWYNGRLLAYSKDGISAYSDKGEQLFNQTYEMQSPLVSVCGDYVAVGDYKGNLIYVLDSGGFKGQIHTNMMIQSLSVSAGGVVTAILDDGDITWINLYTQTGEVVTTIRTTMKQTGYPLSCVLSPDNIKLAVSYLTAKNGQLHTDVAFYNFGDVGQNESGRLVSAENFGEEVIPFLDYPTEDVAVALGNEKLYFFKGKQIPKMTAEAELSQEVRSVYCGENQVVLIFNNTDGDGKYRMISYDLTGKEKINHTFDIEYTDILVQNEFIVIYNDSQVLIVNRRGDVKFSGSFGDNIIALIPTASVSRYLAVTGTDMRNIRLK